MKMVKRVLIIAHFYEPLNTVASHRPKVWAEQLKNSGYDVTIATNKWTGKEASWNEILGESKDNHGVEIEENGITILKIPYKLTFFQKVLIFFKYSRALRNLLEFLYSLVGNLEIDRDINKSYFKFLDEKLAKEKFDLIIVTCNPFSGLLLASRLAQKHNIKWFADLRDMWNMKFQLKNPKSIKTWMKIKTFFEDKIILKQLSKSNLIITCNQTYIDILKMKLPTKEYLLVMNGYEEKIFNTLEDHSELNEKFTVLCLGTLHLQQEKQMFSNAIKKLTDKYGTGRILIKFLGVDINPKVGEQVKNLFSEEILETTSFIDRSEALKEIKNSHLTFYPMWDNYTGLLPVKFFEYLGARKNILMIPKDNGLLDAILAETNSGISSSKQDEIDIIIENYYKEWLDLGKLDYKGNEEGISKYSRENQTELLIEKMSKF